MADTQRSRSAVLSLFADNVTGQISAQDLRDFVVTLMDEAGFQFAGDFWVEPAPVLVDVDYQYGRGWKEYSVILGDVASWGDILFLSTDGYWYLADPTDSTENKCLAMAMQSGNAAGGSGIILRRGLARNSGTWSVAGYSLSVGKFVFLNSATPGAIAGSATTSRIVGFWEHRSDTGDVYFRFCPDGWGVSGT